jgi:SAM-dependent methyltransferase
MKISHRTRANESYGSFSERFPVLYDIPQREKKALKVLAVCRHFSPRPLSELTCLDLGSSTGIMTERFADEFKRVIALDIDRDGLFAGKRNNRKSNIDYLCSDGAELPLADNSVDVVICNQIYEHVDNQSGLLMEIYRTMKDSGFCYFGAGNRYVLIEGHYFLPFLSWLPHRLADIYMKLAGKKGIYDVKLLSLRKLRRLTDKFWRHDYTGLIFEVPDAFYADDVVEPDNIISRLPKWAFGLVYPFFPAWVWVLTRKK